MPPDDAREEVAGGEVYSRRDRWRSDGNDGEIRGHHAGSGGDAAMGDNDTLGDPGEPSESDADEDEKRGWLAILALIISVGSLLISAGSFIVSSWQYSAVTRHYRLSVRPHVVINFILEGGRDERNGIYIANPGLGPAIIKALSVEVGGKSYDAMDKRVWQNVFRDLTIVPGCFRQGWAQSGNALKAGEELALLTITRANPPIVDAHSCLIELLKLLKAEGLKVRIQYESMYGEPDEAISESWIDSNTISDISTAVMQQVMPKLAEQLQSLLAKFTQLGDRMQQLNVEATKRTADLAERIMLRELYENPLDAIWRLQLQERISSMTLQD